MLLLLQIGEIASRYQLHTSLPSRSDCTFARSFSEYPNSSKSAYLDLQHFHRRSSKFPAEHLFFVVGMIYSLFYRHLYSILGQQLSFKRKHRGVVPIDCPWSRMSKTSQLKLKCEVSRTEKVQECDYVLGSSTTFQRRKEWICESRCRQVSVRLRVFAGFFTLKSFHDYSLCLVFILPQPAFYS